MWFEAGVGENYFPLPVRWGHSHSALCSRPCFPAGSHGDYSNPNCSSVLPSSPWRPCYCHPMSELSSLLMGWFTYNQIHLVCVYSLKFGNWMRLGYDHHDPDVRHWRSYHMTLSGQIPFFSSYSSIHRSWITTSEFFETKAYYQPWLAWYSRCRPGLPWTWQRSACLCLLRREIKNVCHYAQKKCTCFPNLWCTGETWV